MTALNGTLLLVRHASATGQAPNALLTPEGQRQADALADALAGEGVQRIVSSPWTRAMQSAQPLAERLGLSVETDARLTERVLSSADLPDWRERLQRSFEEPDARLPGGESSRAAQARGLAAVRDALTHGADVTVIVTHGNLLTLLLQAFDRRVSFHTWARLRNPDVFRLRVQAGRALPERLLLAPLPAPRAERF